MEEGIRKANLFGGYKTIIGDGKSDIVLETLGKVYIKTGNNFRLINEICKQVSNVDPSDSKSVIMTSDIDELKYPGNGKLVFDTDLEALYITYDSRYILLLDNNKVESSQSSPVPEGGEGYVKKTGDEMSGALSIIHKGAPLIIASKEFVSNLNVEYINGFSSNELAIKHLNELITGSWTFDADVTVNPDLSIGNDLTLHHDGVVHNNFSVDNVLESKKELIVKNTIGTKYFLGGYNGYGWRLDSNTNMLTVDYLVVRKAMMVYELVLNRISATNGSLWVTDATKVDKVQHIKVLNLSTDITLLQEKTWFTIPDTILSISIEGKHIANTNGQGSDTIFYNCGYLLYFTELPDNINSLTEAEILTSPNLKKYLLFPDLANTKKLSLDENKSLNPIYNKESTPYFYSTQSADTFKTREHIQTIYSYYKYFASSTKYPTNIYVVELKKDLFPTIREGDIIRCQKFKEGSVKYYDALVAGRIDNSYRFILLLAKSVFDLYTDDLGETSVNTKAYAISDPDPNNTEVKSNTEESATIKIKSNPDIILAAVEPKDDLVRIGSLTNPIRRGSLYLSSSDADSPNLKVLDGVNKPDYSVLYTSPKFSTIKYKDKLYFYILEEKDTGKENCHQIEDLWYSLFTNPTPQCAIETTKEGDFKSECINHVKVQLGKLDGIHDDLFGDHQPKGYGLYGLNVYLTGEFYLNNGKSVARIGDDILLQVKTEYAQAGLSIKVDDETKKSSIVLNGDLIVITNGDGSKQAAVFHDGMVDLTYARISDKLDVGNGNFVVYSDGSFIANNATLKGDILAGDKTSKIEILSNNGDPGSLILYEPKTSANFSFVSGSTPSVSASFSGYNYISIDCEIEIICPEPSYQDETVSIILKHEYGEEPITDIIIPRGSTTLSKTIFWNHNRIAIDNLKSYRIGIAVDGQISSVVGPNTITFKNLRVFNAEYLIYPSEPSINIYTENQLTTLFNGASAPSISSNEQINCLTEPKKALFNSDNVKNHIISLYTYKGLSKNFNLAFTGYVKNLSKLGNMKNPWGLYLRRGSSKRITIRTFSALQADTSESIDTQDINISLQSGDILEVHISNVLNSINPVPFGLDIEAEISKCILTEIGTSFAHYYTNGFVFKSELSSILAESNAAHNAHLNIRNPNISTFLSDSGINYLVPNSNQSPSPILIYKGTCTKSDKIYVLSGDNIFTEPFTCELVDNSIQFNYPTSLKSLIAGKPNRLFIQVQSKVVNQHVVVSEITDSYFTIKHSGENAPEFYILISYYNF